MELNNENKDKIDKYIDSAEFELYMEMFGNINVIRDQRFDKFETYLETNDFPTVLELLLKKQNTDRFNLDADISNIIKFIFSYLFDRHECIITPEWIDSSFITEVVLYKSHFFVKTQGQGVIYEIYNRNKKLIFQS